MIKMENADNYDYSGVCLLVTKALEVEVAKRFFYSYKDYLTQKVNEFLFGLRTLLNAENLLVSDIAELFFVSIYNIKAEFLSEEQVRAQLKKTYKKKCKSPLFLDYVLSTSFSTYRQAEGYEPRLRYEVTSISRACAQFAA